MIHHFAIAVKDFATSHYFYTKVMRFKLVAGVKRQAPGGGWTKHMFYDMGDGKLMAIWDLKGIEGVQIQPGEWRSAISKGLGLPGWINHYAFQCSGEEELQRRKQDWLDNGYHVSESDHAFIRSIYTYDPDGNWIEWTYDTRGLTEADRIEAEEILADDTPATEHEYEGPFTRSTVQKYRATART
ncbi:MAG TPA: VOC family protein [Caulobacterales bacterium]|nr:VOC family protein [Caulobacterales bacterium]